MCTLGWYHISKKYISQILFCFFFCCLLYVCVIFLSPFFAVLVNLCDLFVYPIFFVFFIVYFFYFFVFSLMYMKFIKLPCFILSVCVSFCFLLLSISSSSWWADWLVFFLIGCNLLVNETCFFVKFDFFWRVIENCFKFGCICPVLMLKLKVDCLLLADLLRFAKPFAKRDFLGRNEKLLVFKISK